MMIKLLLLLLIFSIPMSFAIKNMFNLNIFWVEPSFIISLLIILAYYVKINNHNDKMYPGMRKSMIYFFVFAYSYIFSILINIFYYNEGNILLKFTEGTKLLLGVCLSYVIYKLLFYYKNRIYYLIAISSIIQMLIAIYFYGIFKYNLPASSNLILYVTDYFNRQAIWTSTPIPRLGGTFFESPPFGLFMLGSLFCLILLKDDNISLKKHISFCLIPFLGAIFSFSSQIIVGLLIFFLGLFLIIILPRKLLNSFLLIYSGILIIGLIAILTIININTNFDPNEIYGNSSGERLYHIIFSFSLIISSFKNLLIGVGPGNYGVYLSDFSSYFPETVTPQVSFVEIIVEAGLLSFVTLIIALISLINKQIKAGQIKEAFMFIGFIVASSFQATWKWPILFVFFAIMIRVINNNNVRKVKSNEKNSY